MPIRVDSTMPAPTVSAQQSPLFLLLTVAIAVLVLLLILGILRLRRHAERKVLAAVLVLGVATVVLGGVMGYGIYQSYVASHTWTFSYSVSIQPNSTAPDAVVLPSVADETLLKGLSVSSGTANWSFVVTDHGRAIYVRFTGNATLSMYSSRYPPPSPLPDTRITLTNGSSSCPQAWFYYPGSAGVWVWFYTDMYSTSSPVRPGWNLYPCIRPPIAVQ